MQNFNLTLVASGHKLQGNRPYQPLMHTWLLKLYNYLNT